MKELLVLIDDQLTGRVRNATGRLSFAYEKSWLESPASHSLSMSMPLAAANYSQKQVMPFLWNLLPENPDVLQRWAQQYHVSPSNPFRMLGFVGADVPGAAQFIADDQYREPGATAREKIAWISIDELTERLAQLRNDISAFRRPGDQGKMSLPGAQAKTAFYRDEKNDRWGVPYGRTPTTHIIKPCVPGFDGLVENEHVCQDLASRLGLPAAKSSVLALDETYIVIERYDRLPQRKGSLKMHRVHQEDMCQALGLMHAKKYQEEGGPGIGVIASLLRRVSSAPDEDVARFMDANAFNWFIGGTDAHAKNYSLLITGGEEVRLAPLYDLSSQLPYTDRIPQKLAMKIGPHYQIGRIGIADWHEAARAAGIGHEQIVSMLMEMAKKLPDHISDARDQAIADGLGAAVIHPLGKLLHEHVEKRLSAISTIYPRRKTTTHRT